jgi:hypothetical protein
MSLHAGWRWGRLLAGAGLPLLAAVLAAPSAARATCGDYVVLGSKSFLTGHVAMAAGGERNGSLPSNPGPRPCSGPMCNGGMPLPAPAPVSMPPSQTEEGICLSGSFLPADPRLTGVLGEKPRACSEGHGLSVYHPPRPHLS